MFDLGWSEMLVVFVVALIIIGPKDLPKLVKQVTQWVRYLRGMAREFQTGIDDMVRDSELDEARKALDFARDVNPKNQLKKLIDPDDDLERDLDIEGQLRGDYDDDEVLFDDDFEGRMNEGPKVASATSTLNSGPAAKKKTGAAKPKPKKPAPKKSTAKKTTAKKPAANKAPSKKVAAQKAAPKKATATKSAPKKQPASKKAKS